MTRNHLSKSFVALLVLIASSPLAAQTVDGPTFVCPGDRFNVEWIGPDANRDLIALAIQQMPADEALDSSPTSDGSPARLRAPLQSGTYKLRYVQFDPQAVLVEEDLIVDECLGSGSADEDWPMIAVQAHGWQIDHGDQITVTDVTPYGHAGYTIDQLCAASPVIGQAMEMMAGQLEAGMAGSPVSIDMLNYVPGAPNTADIAQDVRNAREAICNSPPPKTTIQPFIITYAYCRMAMNTPTNTMDIHLPVGRDGSMSMADHLTQEVVRLTMRQNFEATAALLGRGWGSDIQMNGPIQSSTHIGYPTRRYDFDYSGGLGEGPAGIPGISNTIKVKNSGTGWFSTQVPGMEIIRIFYQRMLTDVSTEGGSMSFFAGMINNLVGMLRKGIPLVMDQTTSSSVMGKTMVSGRSQHYLTSIKLVDIEQQWCEQSLMPSGYAVTDVDAQIAEAMGSSGVDNEELSAAMAEYNQAMQQMTPEQRAMMESMGMGDMMQQAMGADGSNARPSAVLTNDNQTQSVQLHLDALGYDTGNTSGEESLATTIAISQYQAERGLAVTGEVSAELLRTLSAEIDGGR